MPRPPRVLAHGCTYHVTARGNDRQVLFHRDIERRDFLSNLAQVIRHRDWKLSAYCLMDNHIHLLVETPEPDLDQGMRDLLSRCARRFNRTQGRCGHVFDGRFHSVVVRDDRQFLATVRYIARNPVVAGLVEAPHEWPWSSYSTLYRDAACSPGLDCGHALQMLHPNERRARDLLRDLVEIDDPSVETGRPGMPSIVTLVHALGRYRGAIAAARLGYLQREIASTVGVDRSTITRWVSNQRVEGDR